MRTMNAHLPGGERNLTMWMSVALMLIALASPGTPGRYGQGAGENARTP